MVKRKKFSEKVYYLVKQIPPGKVSSYQEIAWALNSKSYKAVGQALKRNPYPPQIPCHRVVKSSGLIGGFKGQKTGKKIKEKIKLLKKEGIKIKKNKVLNFKKVFKKF